MNTSTSGKQLIKEFEGLRLRAYPDGAGYSVGYGHWGVSAGTVITQLQAEMYFEQDIQRFENYINSLGLDINQNQFDALVSFTYNTGEGGFSGTMLEMARNNPNDPAIANEFARKVYSQGQILQALKNRRQIETELYFSPPGISKIAIASLSLGIGIIALLITRKISQK